MKKDKEMENESAAREHEATSAETLSDMRDAEKSSSATTDEAGDAVATPDGQFDGDSSSQQDGDLM